MTRYQPDHATRIMTLEQRGRVLAAQLEQLGEQRKQRSLAAAEGEERSLQQVMAADATIAKLRTESEAVRSAVEQLQSQQAEADAEAARAEQEARQQQADELAAAALTLSDEVDATMRKLVDALQRRDQLLDQLGAIRPDSFIQRLRTRPPVTAAARSANLHSFIHIEHVAPSSVCSLADASRGLVRTNGGSRAA